MFENNKLNLFLLKNTIISLIPVAILIAAVIIAMQHYDLFTNLDFYSLDDPSQIEQAYEDGISNVTITFEKLSNMGFDYMESGEKAGSYYYSYSDGKIAIVLIDREEEVLYDYQVKGRIKEDSAAYSYIISHCADIAGIDKSSLEFVTCDYIISEMSHPVLYYTVIKLAICVIFLIILVSFMDIFASIFIPWMHPQIRMMRGKFDKKLFVRDLNRQLRYYLIYKGDGCYITKKYMVLCTPLHTQVIIRQKVEAVSRHKETKKSFLFVGGKNVYRLIISSANGIIYEHAFKSKQACNEVYEVICANTKK